MRTLGLILVIALASSGGGTVGPGGTSTKGPLGTPSGDVAFGAPDGGISGTSNATLDNMGNLVLDDEVLAVGGGGLQLWNSTSHTHSFALFMQVPGGSLTDDAVFSRNYLNGGWQEMARFSSAAGHLLLGTSTDNGVDELQVAGTAAAMRATSMGDLLQAGQVCANLLVDGGGCLAFPYEFHGYYPTTAASLAFARNLPPLPGEIVGCSCQTITNGSTSYTDGGWIELEVKDLTTSTSLCTWSIVCVSTGQAASATAYQPCEAGTQNPWSALDETVMFQTTKTDGCTSDPGLECTCDALVTIH